MKAYTGTTGILTHIAMKHSPLLQLCCIYDASRDTEGLGGGL